MSWLEVPFLLALCGALYTKLIDIDKRMDAFAERLVRIETLMQDMPKRKYDEFSDR